MENVAFEERAKIGMTGKYCCCFEPSLMLVRGRRKLTRLFWRVRAEIKRQMKDNLHHHHHRKSCLCCCCRFSFHYDSSSYALNFDNGNSGFFC